MNDRTFGAGDIRSLPTRKLTQSLARRIVIQAGIGFFQMPIAA